ncbi:nitrilase-related carbon-nitrogen hydrolase [Pseudomonas putida]
MPSVAIKVCNVVDQLKVSIAVFRIKHYTCFEEYAEHVESFVQEAKRAGSRVVLFPEFLPMGLLWTDPQAAQVDNLQVAAFYRRVLTPLLPRHLELMSTLAKAHDIYLLGGTYWHEEAGTGYNSGYVFKPDGSHVRQHKIHMTRGERAIQTRGGEELNVFEVDGVKCGMVVCYDLQYPELTQHFARQGVEVLFVPTLTDELGTWREWHSGHARAVENQMYVCISTLVGDLGIPYDYPARCSGQAFVACPIDNKFKIENGTYAVSNFEEEGLLHSELDLAVLRLSRERAEVKQLKDRRPEIYARLAESLENG